MPSPIRPQRGAASFPPPKKSSRYVDEDDLIDEDEDDVPVTPRRKSTPQPPPTPKKSRFRDYDEDEDELPNPRTKVAPTPTPKPKRKTYDEDEDDYAPTKTVVRKPIYDEDELPVRKPSRKPIEEDEDEVIEPPKRRTSGWAGVKEAKEASVNINEGIPQDFWLLSGEEAFVQFLDDAPICYTSHSVTIDGKRKQLPCQKEHKATCLMCNDGIKANFVAAMRVLDFRGSWDKDANRGKGAFKYDKPVEKIWRMSKGVAIQLEEYKTKRSINLLKTVLLVSKSGTAKTTRWNIERGLDEEENPVKCVKHTSTVSNLEDVVVKISDKYLIANNFEGGDTY